MIDDKLHEWVKANATEYVYVYYDNNILIVVTAKDSRWERSEKVFYYEGKKHPRNPFSFSLLIADR